jgi:predicted enzyme related to lactoylglutathione lyase
MPNTFDWVELNAKNLDMLSEFYKNVFGWEIKNIENIQGYEFRIFTTGGKPRVENLSRFGIWQNPTKSTNGLLVYIWVENIDTILGKIIVNGGKVTEGKNFIGPGYRAIISDPEGNIFALFEEK